MPFISLALRVAIDLAARAQAGNPKLYSYNGQVDTFTHKRPFLSPSAEKLISD